MKLSASDRAVIARELGELGYDDAGRREYRGRWGNNDVYHRLRLVESPFASGLIENALSYRFWFGNPSADQFCAESVRKFGSPAFSSFQFSSECPAVASFTGTRGPIELWYLDTEKYDALQIAKALRTELEEAVLYRVRSVTTLDQLYTAVLGNNFPWHKVNSLMRTALIVYLGVLLKKDRDEIAIAAIQAGKGIGRKIPNKPDRTDIEVIKNIWIDAERTCA